MYPYNAQSAEAKDEKGIISAQNDVFPSNSQDISRILDLLESAVSAKEKAAEKYSSKTSKQNRFFQHLQRWRRTAGYLYFQ